jgi:hypothetical protein
LELRLYYWINYYQHNQITRLPELQQPYILVGSPKFARTSLLGCWWNTLGWVLGLLGALLAFSHISHTDTLRPFQRLHVGCAATPCPRSAVPPNARLACAPYPSGTRRPISDIARKTRCPSPLSFFPKATPAPVIASFRQALTDSAQACAGTLHLLCPSLLTLSLLVSLSHPHHAPSYYFSFTAINLVVFIELQACTPSHLS